MTVIQKLKLLAVVVNNFTSHEKFCSLVAKLLRFMATWSTCIVM